MNKNEWISVDDRLPPRGERVLATTGGGVFVVWTDNDDEWYIGGIRFEQFFGFVTHWMPLPEAPKGGDTND